MDEDIAAGWESFILRVAQMLSFDLPLTEIHEEIVKQGISESDFFLIHHAAQARNAIRDTIPTAYQRCPECDHLCPVVANGLVPFPEPCDNCCYD